MTKYFVTGATGFVGSLVVEELIANGYHVLGLARSDRSADKLTSMGAEVIRGDLEDLEVLKKGAETTDGTMHLGYIHDFANYGHSGDVDFRATETMINALKGTGKLFIYTSGLAAVFTDIGVQASEADLPDPAKFPDTVNQRIKTEIYALEAGKKENVRSMVLRLAPTVHGKNDHQFITILVAAAKKNGISYYPEEGKNTWSAVHRKDAAVLYRLAAEKGKAGVAYHAAAEESVPTKDIAEAIGERLNIESKSLPASEVAEKLAFIGFMFSLNVNTSSQITRQELGWNPTEIKLLEDIRENY